MKTLNNYKPPLLLKRLTQLFGAICLTSGAAMFYLENSFVFHSHVAQPELGRTISYAFKGAIFYITPDEHFWIKLIYYVFTASFLVMAALIIYCLAKMGFPLKGEQ